MAIRNDLTGMVVGKLTVLNHTERNKHGQMMWECLCECGNKTIVVSGSLVNGTTKSCRCIVPNFKHGGHKKSSYNTWKSMVARCTHTQNKDYYKYGAVGIKVCSEWLNYLNFEKDMGEPVGTETLDRIDTYGNYTKENCRWASITVQNRNVRLRKTNTTGYIGVSNVYGKYMAKITVKKKAYYSKVYPTVEEAAQASKDLKLKYWGVE
jgi:hypothetical protein